MKATCWLNSFPHKFSPNEPRHDKTNKMSVLPTKTQISLGIRPDWSESSLCAQWVAKDPRFVHADSEDWSDWADQTEILFLLEGGHPDVTWCKINHVFPEKSPIRFVATWTGGLALKLNLLGIAGMRTTRRIQEFQEDIRLVISGGLMFTGDATKCTILRSACQLSYRGRDRDMNQPFLCLHFSFRIASESSVYVTNAIISRPLAEVSFMDMEERSEHNNSPG